MKMSAAITAAVIVFTTPLYSSEVSRLLRELRGPEYSFVRGVEAFQKKEWEKAVRYLRDAIQLSALERSERTIFAPKVWGWKAKEYTPYLYLAGALAQLPDCRGALQAFEESEVQGVGPRATVYSTIQQMVAPCVGAEASNPTQTAPALPTADVQTASVSSEGSAPVEPRTETTAPAAPAEVAGADPDPAAKSSKSTLAQKRRPEASTVDPRIDSAVRLYVAGEYSRVLLALAGPPPRDTVSRRQALLLQAAAHHALFVLSGEKDANARVACDSELREYWRLGGGPIDPMIFAPSFRSFAQRK